MGFSAARPAPKATLLVGYVATDVAEAEKGGDAGADVVLLRSAAASAVSAVEKLRPETAVVGLWADVGSEAAMASQKAGVDFLVINPDTTPAATLLNEELGYVLVLPAEPDELLLRSLEPLALDGLLLSDIAAPLTVTRQIELARISSFARKPLICKVKPDVGSEELQCLRAAGAALLLIEGGPGAIAPLKERVVALPARHQRRDDRPVVALPRGQAPAEEDNDDDDEDYQG